jgi:hypothetical protein
VLDPERWDFLGDGRKKLQQFAGAGAEKH